MAYSKYCKEDFISWDDIDLTGTECEGESEDLEWQILECVGSDHGESGESDCGWDSQDRHVEADEQSSENKPPKSKKKKGKTSNNLYVCPVCNKKLKTVAGFRGHVDRQHQKPHLKAHDHKQSSGSTSSVREVEQDAKKASASSSAGNKTPSVSIPLTTLEELTLMMPNILEASLVNIDKSTIGEEMSQLVDELGASPLNDIALLLAEQFTPVFGNMGKGTSLALDREQMWQTFNKLRFDPDRMNQLSQLIIEKINCSHISAKLLVQVVLEEAMSSVISHQLTLVLGQCQDADGPDSKISEGDQGALYYICGFLLHALKKRFWKSTSQATVILREMVSRLGTKSQSYQEESDFLTNIRKWTDICDRGGLVYAKKDFYLMVRQMENLLRTSIDLTCLSAFSLQRENLKEVIVSDFLVKHYWDTFFSGDSEGTKLLLLDNIVGLFIKMRGKAITVYVRRQAQKSKREKNIGKRGKKASLRKSLRDRQ